MKIAAVILGAGKGTRMNEGRASAIPKVMFEANGKPLIDHMIDSFDGVNLEKIVVVVGYKKEMIMDHLGDKVEYAEQKEQLGTGHATMMAKDKVKDKVDAIIVCYGDMPLYKSETINSLVETFGKEKPTLAMLTVDFEDPEFWAYGRVIRDGEGNIVANVEQKDCTPDQLKIKESNPSFYIFDSDWLWENFDKLSTDNAQGEYYLTDMIKIANDQGKKVVGVKVSEENEVFGVNNPEQLKEVEEILDSRE